jgi:hypothetical protein
MIESIKRELLRLRGELAMLVITLAVFAGVGISRGNFEVIVYKLALLALATVTVHISRQLVWDYVCIEDALFGENRFAGVPVAIRAVVVAGMLFLYPVLIYAVMVAG